MLGALEKFMALTNLVSENEKIDDHKSMHKIFHLSATLLMIQILTKHLDQCIKKLWKILKNLLANTELSKQLWNRVLASLSATIACKICVKNCTS